MRRLEAFLDENSPQLVYWLANLFNGQQNSISYAELEAAALAGYEAQIRQWQQEYAKFVNDKLNPMWLLAIGAGAKQFELKHGKPLDDSDFFVKNWLNNHAGQFITNINAETRQAIKSILYYCQDQQMNPKQIAQAIRPTIGLTQQQAIANLRYKEHVKRTLLKDHPRMSEAKAEERAQRAALKYSSQQQRYRAETIARTELAFAYNRGAHESVRQAVANGLMGRCEKVWSTAGTNRVCGRCRDLSGKVVGFDDKFFDSRCDTGETPPLHPRCRCVIIYREVDTPRLHSTSNNDKINNMNENIVSEMTRQFTKPLTYKPVSEERYQQLIVPLKMMGVTIMRGGQEVEAHLDKFNAQASNFGTGLVFFRQDISISAILEETHHVIQNRQGMNDDKPSDIRTVLNEIDAKEYLLQVASQYGIPREEIEETKMQLEQYKEELKRILAQRGENDV